MLIPLESLLSNFGQAQCSDSSLRDADHPSHLLDPALIPPGEPWGEKELEEDPNSLTDTATAFSQGWQTQICLCSDCAQRAKGRVWSKGTSTLTFKNSASKKKQIKKTTQLSPLIFKKLNKKEKATQILHLNLSSTVAADGTQAQLCLCFETYCTLSVAFVDFNYSKLKRMTSKTRDFDMTMIRFAKTSFKIFRYISYHRQ